MFVKACQIFGRSSISKGAGLLWGYHHVSGIPVSGRLYGSHCINGRLCGSHHTSDISVSSAFCGNHQIRGIPIKYGYLFLSIRCLHQKQLNTDYWHAFQLIKIPVRNFSITPYLCKVSASDDDKKADRIKSVKISLNPGIGSSDLEHKKKKIQSALQKGKTVQIYFYKLMKLAKSPPPTDASKIKEEQERKRSLKAIEKFVYEIGIGKIDYAAVHKDVLTITPVLKTED